MRRTITGTPRQWLYPAVLGKRWSFSIICLCFVSCNIPKSSWQTQTLHTKPGWCQFTFHLATALELMKEEKHTNQEPFKISYKRRKLKKPPQSWWKKANGIFFFPLCTIFHQAMKIPSSSQSSYSVFFDSTRFCEKFIKGNLQSSLITLPWTSPL